MEGIWWVVFAAILTIGITSAHLAEILVKQISPHVKGWLKGDTGSAPRGELADIRSELEASRREIARMRTVEEEVDRLQEQVEFLEQLLGSGRRSEPVPLEGLSRGGQHDARI